MRRIFGAIALLGLLATSARGDGFFYQLPEDGTWAKYEIDITQERGGMQQSNHAELTMASVGKSVENAEPCRWIEVRLKMNDNGNEHTIVAKVLTPEKYLKKGEDPLNQMVRGWLKGKGGSNDQSPEKLEASNFGPLRAFLAGALQDEKKLDKEVVDSKLGNQECEGVTGHAPFTEGDREGKFTFTNRLHPKAPFGLVAGRLEFGFKRDGQVVESGTATFKLIDFGKDAISELPGYQ
jgi:hypothetical protein